jgi:hypothetical protein
MLIESNEVSREKFFNEASSIEYRDDDIREANEFGCKDIITCFKKAISPFARYFIVYEDSKPICAVILRRDGNIVFFTSKNITNHLGLIKALRKLALSIVHCCGSIITKTASWYSQAIRLNRLVGFKPYKIYNKFTLYVMV